ncbi:MAG: hypothetical protein NTW87_18605 [Planctomycetota bacterium]|nr:hypothetical protein [Planctomycetota bacterium]
MGEQPRKGTRQRLLLIGAAIIVLVSGVAFFDAARGRERQEHRRERQRLACELRAKTEAGVPLAARAAQPLLPRVQSGATTSGAVRDQTGNFQWRPAKLASQARTDEKVTASATRSEQAWSKALKGRYDPDYPAGTIKREAAMQVSGWPVLTHEDFQIPAGVKAEKRWDYDQVPLPGGASLLGSSLCCQTGNRNFSPWSFLNLAGKRPGGTKTESLLKPALCIAANSYNGEGWASSELVFERPLTDACTMRFFIRIKRVAGDPYLYVLILADPQGGAVETVDLHGYPNSPHPIFYGLVPQFPTHAPFLERERWVWLAGCDWSMHTKEKRVLAITPELPGGAFWYNRQNSEVGGMQMVFMPEELTSARADGTYGVAVTLSLKGSVVRLALLEWSDWQGWETAREDFIKDLPARTKKLREMSFAWPIKDALPEALRRQAETLLAAESLAKDAREKLRAVLDECKAAAETLRAAPVNDTAERFQKEGKVLVLKGRAEDAVKPLVGEWVKRGGGD